MKRIYILLSAALLLCAACSRKEVEAEETSAETVAEIEAAQMMGRDAARDFTGRQWNDTLDLQRHLMDVKSVQSKFELEGKKQCAAAFDSAFVSTMQTVRPELADHLLRHYDR